MAATSQEEIAARERFAFGENWTRFLGILDESRIQRAEDSLRRMLDVSDLNGKTFSPLELVPSGNKTTSAPRSSAA